jgi:flagellar basal-body rod protein FlgB
MIDRLTDSFEFHSQALALRAERQRVIASNIANADTPGYQARDIDFAQALRSATAALPASAGGGASAGGIASGIAGSVMAGGLRGGAPALRYAVPSQTSADSNTVDMDRERGAFIDNSVKYEATLRFINGSVRTMLDAMKSFHQA